MAGSSGGQKRQRSEDDPELAPAEKRPRLISQESTHEFEKLRNDFQRAEISPNASDIELSNQALDSSMRAEVSDNAQYMPSALAESTAEGVGTPETMLGCVCALCGKSATRADSPKHHITGVYGKNGRVVKSTCPYRAKDTEWDKNKCVITNVLFYKSLLHGGLGDPLDAELIPNIRRASEAKLAIGQANTLEAKPTRQTSDANTDSIASVDRPTMLAVLCYLCGESFTRKDSVGHHIKGRNGKTGNNTKKCSLSTAETVWDHTKVKENVLCYMKTKRSPGKPVDDGIIEALQQARDNHNARNLPVLSAATAIRSAGVQGQREEIDVLSISLSQNTAQLKLDPQNFGFPTELQYSVLHSLLTISQRPDYIAKANRHDNFYLPVLAVNRQARHEGLGILLRDNLWVSLEISHSSELNIWGFLFDRLDSQAYVEERIWGNRIKPCLKIEVGIMTEDCDRMGNIITTSYLFAFNPGQLERLCASLRVMAQSIHFLKVNYTKHKLLCKPEALVSNLVVPLSTVRGCSRVDIRGDFGEHNLYVLQKSMTSPLPNGAELIQELQENLKKGENLVAQGSFAEALLVFDVNAYVADHGQSIFATLPHSPLENLFDVLRCKLNRKCSEVKCSLIDDARIDGDISKDTFHWAEKAVDNADDAFGFCGISDDDIALTHQARARAYDLMAQWEVQEQKRLSTVARRLYLEAARDYLCAIRTMGEVTEIENRLMEIESLLGECEDELEIKQVRNEMGVVVFEGDARLVARWGEDLQRRDVYLQLPQNVG